MQDDRFDFKRITDPVHGTIGISEVERRVIDSPVFQRLHEVKQLGLAAMVYPGANYSRFSHSLGTCHVAGRIASTVLRDADDQDAAYKRVQKFRLAGLLHDIGHYPYSHTFENAIKSFYADAWLTKSTFPPGSDKANPPVYLSHEKVSGLLIQSDSEIRSAISAICTPTELFKIINGQSDDPLQKVISSDLDADRLDYLLRTAHFSGLPYGSIDLNYIVSRACFDADGRLAFTRPALRAVDQFLISRYFDYRQVAFHKTTAGMEWILEDLIAALLAVDANLDYTANGVAKRVENKSWQNFTDAQLLTMIADKLCLVTSIPGPGDQQLAQARAAVVRLKTKAFLERKPPKMVGEIELFDPRPDSNIGNARQHDSMARIEHALQSYRSKWSKQFEIPDERWKIWTKDMTITKVGSHVPVSDHYDNEASRNPKHFTDATRITDSRGGKSELIIAMPQSLTSVMARYNMRLARVYVVLDDGELQKKQAIQSQIREDLPYEGWIGEH